MPATTTKIGIINRALQHLGQPPISSLNENSNNSKIMLNAYDPLLLAELRANTWKFAIKRASLPAAVGPPIFGKSFYYPLPGDFLFLAPEETSHWLPRTRDYEIEGTNIVSDEPSPIPIRYVSSSITEATFDALFAESFAGSLALNTCEAVTNSNSKMATIERHYVAKINMAKKRNSIESPPRKAPLSPWIAVRE